MKRLACVALAAVVLVGCKDAMQVEVLTPIDPFCIAQPSGIVSWWPGEGSASDVVGLNDGELMNGTTFEPGKVGLAFSLDAVDDVVWAPAEIVGDLQRFTVEMWVKLDALLPAAIEQRLVTLGNEKAVLRLFRGSRDTLEFYMRIDGQIALLIGGSALQAGVFHHVVGTYDGSAMKLFVDGVRIAARSAEGTVQTTEDVLFGAADGPLAGLLDEITVYDRALLETEIQAIFDAGSAGKCRPGPS